MATEASESLADDRLVGVKTIARFIDPKLSMWKAQKLLEEGHFPHSKEGRVYVASKRAILEKWRRVTSGEPAQAAGREAERGAEGAQ